MTGVLLRPKNPREIQAAIRRHKPKLVVFVGTHEPAEPSFRLAMAKYGDKRFHEHFEKGDVLFLRMPPNMTPMGRVLNAYRTLKTRAKEFAQDTRNPRKKKVGVRILGLITEYEKGKSTEMLSAYWTAKKIHSALAKWAMVSLYPQRATPKRIRKMRRRLVLDFLAIGRMKTLEKSGGHPFMEPYLHTVPLPQGTEAIDIHFAHSFPRPFVLLDNETTFNEYRRRLRGIGVKLEYPPGPSNLPVHSPTVELPVSSKGATLDEPPKRVLRQCELILQLMPELLYEVKAYLRVTPQRMHTAQSANHRMLERMIRALLKTRQD